MNLYRKLFWSRIKEYAIGWFVMIVFALFVLASLDTESYSDSVLDSIPFILMLIGGVVQIRDSYLHTVVANPYRKGKKFSYYRRTPKQINFKLTFFQILIGLIFISFLLSGFNHFSFWIATPIIILILQLFKDKKSSRIRLRKSKLIEALREQHLFLPEESIWDIESDFDIISVNDNVKDTLQLFTEEDRNSEGYFYAITSCELIVGVQRLNTPFFYTAIPLQEITKLAIIDSGYYKKNVILGSIFVIGYGMNRQLNYYTKNRMSSILQPFFGSLVHALDAQTWQEPTFTGFPHRDHPAFVAYEFHGDLSSYPEPYLPFLRQP
ncbi:hypothetical protein [Paenibacillus kyungheensis]